MKPHPSADTTAPESQQDGSRESNLAEYIRSARKSALILDVDWDKPYWKGVGYFVKQSHAPRGSLPKYIPSETWLDASFIDFAKAYIVERRLANPGEHRAGHTQRLQMLRLIEVALLEERGQANPLDIDLGVFDSVAARARCHLKPHGANRIGNELIWLAELLVRHDILPAICAQWSNPNQQPKDITSRVGAEAEQARQQRLPNHEALHCLASIFNRDLDTADPACQRDIYTTSVAALLMCAPSRGQEIHRLPVNLVFEATDKFGNEQLGLRLQASKGFGAYVKWVWSEMVPVAEKAIERLKAITEEARKLARHLEDPSTASRFYRHQHCPAVGDNEPLTQAQVCVALGYVQSNLSTTLRQAGLEPGDGRYTLQRLWDEFVLPRHRDLHPSFPYVSARDQAAAKRGGLKYSEALCCMLRHQLSVHVGTSPILLWMPDLTIFNFEVGGGRPQTSIFRRYGYTRPDGTPLKITSNQVRHLINTEAQRAGLTDEQIAHWSGRSHVAQNTVYDHRTVAERVEQARDVVQQVQSSLGLPGTEQAQDQSVSHGQWLIKIKARPRSCEDIEEIQPQLTGLKTLYGECHHDWALAPCEGFVRCLDCSEHACIKGADDDARVKLDRLKRLHQSVLLEVENARLASEEDVDARDWLRVQERYAAKVEQLISILQSESVPDGSIIRSAEGQHPTHLHRALRGLARNALERGTESSHVMRQMLDAIDLGLTTSQTDRADRADASLRLHGT